MMLQLEAARELPPPEQLEELTRTILSRPEFSSAAQTGGDNPLAEWFQDLMVALASWALAHPDAARFFFWLTALALLALVLYLITRLAWRVGRRRDPQLPEDSSGGQADWEQRRARAADWQSGLSRARRELAGDRMYEAVGMGHRALLALLESRGLLRFAGWKTNRDYLRECPQPSPWFDLLASLSQAYDRIVYAHRRFPRGELSGLLDRVEADARRGD